MENTPSPTPARKPRTKKAAPVVQEAEIIEASEVITIPPAPAAESSSEETITFKRSHFYSILVVLAFTVGILVGYVAWGRDSVVTVAAPPAQQQAAAAATAQPQYRRYDIPVEGYPSLGPDNAKITIVEFSDFECPYCRRFHEDTYQALLDAYPGEIRFVYRNLPLTSIHPSAMSAAVASLCANDQNAYWEYHDKLFTNEVLNEETYIQHATDLGLDVNKFTACLSDGSHDSFIADDMQFALDLGVQSTPTFFINGLAVVGAQPLANFQQIIDKELAGEIP